MNGSQPDMIFHRAFNAVGPGKMWLSQDSYLPLFGTPDSLATEVKISQWTQAEGLRCELLFCMIGLGVLIRTRFLLFYMLSKPWRHFLLLDKCCRCQPGAPSPHASPIDVCFLDAERALA